MNKTLTRKFIYVLAALAMLAMLIPTMALPVAAAPALTMQLIDPITGLPVPGADSGWNVTGSRVLVTANFTVANWSIINLSTAPGAGPAVITANTSTTATVQGVWGDAEIQATPAEGPTVTIEKKWGQIDHTSITPPGWTPVTWNEGAKAWSANATITDTVIGAFYEKDPVNPPDPSHILLHNVQGVILNWYLVAGTAVVPTAAADANVLIPQILALPKPTHVTFSTGGTTATNVSNGMGTQTVTLVADGEEAVQIVVIPQYPFAVANIPVVPEVTSWDFYTTEMEVVPQVRWAGEKIVLEKNFGTVFHPPSVNTQPLYLVRFSTTDDNAILEAIGNTYIPLGGGNFSNTPQSVWTTVDANGFASVVLYDANEGAINVAATLYELIQGNNQTMNIINQHHFTVYFLKFERLTLGDVNGKRDGHNSGLWTPPNPWDTTTDNTTQTLNVSQDALLRARVSGWFTSVNPSVRPVRTIDPANSTLENPTTATLTLPAGRWILPDDWAALAGPNWQQSRLHWDIMCNPDGSVGATDSIAALGPSSVYKMPPITGKAVSGQWVIGPFSPGLELMTPIGWAIPNPGYDPQRLPGMPISTVVPDGVLNRWDAPMPPAKIIFQIQAGTSSNIAGYFKSANKTDIYYIMSGTTKVYTNPFYQELIPAHQAIPPFINNGGYDWDSFNKAYGPYVFWTMINQSSNVPLVPTSDPSGHPTNAEVYSDNHGEAMIWLNGNWNLNLSAWSAKGAADIPINTTVGMTTIQATADYPYSRVHQAIQSNKDVKTWLWGGQILGADSHLFGDHTTTTVTADTRMVLSGGNYDATTVVGTFPNQAAKSLDKVVWIWVTDRDGQRAGVTGTRVDWVVTTTAGGGAKINTAATGSISNYNSITGNITLTNGFLSGTGGMVTDGANAMHGVSFVRVPTSYEIQLFNKFWGSSPAGNPANPNGTSSIRADASKYLVAALDLQAQGGYSAAANVQITLTSHDFDAVMGQMVPGSLIYETNLDFNVIDALDDGIRTGDANYDGAVNMGDVTAVERMILGYNPIASNAVLNSDGSVDMGTVVKIERLILGLR